MNNVPYKYFSIIIVSLVDILQKSITFARDNTSGANFFQAPEAQHLVCTYLVRVSNLVKFYGTL